MSKIQYVLIALAAAVVILAAGSIYTVNQGEQALVLQFGRPVRVVKEPGLKLKIPMLPDYRPAEVLQNRAHRISGAEQTGGNRQFLHPQDPRPQHLTGTVVAEAHPDHERHQRRG